MPLAHGELVLVAVGSDGDAGDVLHGEVGTAFGRRPGVEDLGDGRVVHQRQGLALGFEARDNLARVHAGLDELDSDAAAHRLLLLRQPDLTHSALTDQFEQLVGPDDCPGCAEGVDGEVLQDRTVEEAASFCVGGEEGFNVLP